MRQVHRPLGLDQRRALAAVGALELLQDFGRFLDAAVHEGGHDVAQAQAGVEALRAGPKTTDDLRALGCYQVSARVFGLRRKGCDIETTLYDAYAVDGYHHQRMARYELLSEPEPEVAAEKGGE